MAAWRRCLEAWTKHCSLALVPAVALASAPPSSCLFAEAARTPPDTVKEPFTGVEFGWKKEISQDEAKGNYHLLGTAVRCMLGQCKFAKARAYAVGLYVVDGSEGLKGATEEDRFQAVLQMNTPRSLVLIMDQDVAGHHIAKGFDRSLLPRIRKAQGGKFGTGKDALRDFTRCFNKEKMLRKGTEICLVWRPDDTLVVMINASVYAIIPSTILCQALFDMYLGPNSIFRKYRNMSFVFHENQSKVD